jgi:hypothetical protein
MSSRLQTPPVCSSSSFRELLAGCVGGMPAWSVATRRNPVDPFDWTFTPKASREKPRAGRGRESRYPRRAARRRLGHRRLLGRDLPEVDRPVAARRRDDGLLRGAPAAAMAGTRRRQSGSPLCAAPRAPRPLPSPPAESSHGPATTGPRRPPTPPANRLSIAPPPSAAHRGVEDDLVDRPLVPRQRVLQLQRARVPHVRDAVRAAGRDAPAAGRPRAAQQQALERVLVAGQHLDAPGWGGEGGGEARCARPERAVEGRGLRTRACYLVPFASACACARVRGAREVCATSLCALTVHACLRRSPAGPSLAGPPRRSHARAAPRAPRRACPPARRAARPTRAGCCPSRWSAGSGRPG